MAGKGTAGEEEARGKGITLYIQVEEARALHYTYRRRRQGHYIIHTGGGGKGITLYIQEEEARALHYTYR